MNKECENVALYFYGELDIGQQRAFKAHLPQCPLCQKELAFLQKTQEALQAPAAAPSCVEAVLKQTRPAGFWQKYFKPVLGAAVLSAGVFLLIFGSGDRQNATQNTTDWVAFVSVQSDEEFNNFAQEFELFESEF